MKESFYNQIPYNGIRPKQPLKTTSIPSYLKVDFKTR